MKLKFLLLALMLSCVTSIFADQSDSNYGTDAVAVIVKQANVLYNKGRLEEAKVLYEQALASGDKFYSKKCVAQLNLIDNLLESKKKKSDLCSLFRKTL